MGLFETGAMLVYLGDKTGKFLPASGAARYHTIQWLMWQMGGVGPMFGQVGYFHRYKGSEIEDAARVPAITTKRGGFWACSTANSRGATGSPANIPSQTWRSVPGCARCG